MSHMSPAEIRSYIANLEIAEADPKQKTVFRADAPAFLDDEPGAVVDSGSLVSFVGGISGLHKSDVLNSTLLAQLAANKQFDRFKQTREWYTFYTDVLSNLAWNIPNFFFREYQPSGTELVLSDAILDILSAIATGDEMKILEAALSGLRDNPSNEGPLTLFDQQSFPENIGTFQIFPCSMDRGDVVMAQAAMQFTSEKHVTRFLWFKWTSFSVKLFQSSQKGVLNEDIYSKIRQDVITKLGDNAKQFILDLKI